MSGSKRLLCRPFGVLAGRCGGGRKRRVCFGVTNPSSESSSAQRTIVSLLDLRIKRVDALVAVCEVGGVGGSARLLDR